LTPFLARAGDGCLFSEELLKLAPDGGSVVVAGDFAFNLVERDVTVVAAMMFWLFRLLGLLRSLALGVDVLFVGGVRGRGSGVRFRPIAGGLGTSGARRCFGHANGFVFVASR